MTDRESERDWYHRTFSDDCFRNEPDFKERLGSYIVDAEERRRQSDIAEARYAASEEGYRQQLAASEEEYRRQCAAYDQRYTEIAATCDAVVAAARARLAAAVELVFSPSVGTRTRGET